MMTRWLLSRPHTACRPAPTRLALTPLEDRAVPATFQVTSNGGDAGAGTLRAVLGLVNASTDATNTVTFLPGLTGPITLTGDLVTVTKPVTITGPGAAALTINGGTNKLFTFDDGTATAIAVSISGLTLTNGKNAVNGGGAVYSKNEAVSVQNCVISNSTAVANNGGGVRAEGGTFTLANTTVTGSTAANGGGVANAGATFTITGSTISNNSATSSGGGYFQSNGILQDFSASSLTGNAADFGGGIDIMAGQASVTASLVSGNFANVSAVSRGGGFEVDGGTVVLKNVTVTGNASKDVGGGVRFFGGTLEIRNSTIAFNQSDSDNAGAEPGGGLSLNVAGAKLFSTIVAKNTRSTAAVATDVQGTVDATSASNLVGVDTGYTGPANTVQGNRVGTAMTPIDPKLKALAFNGGPTQTLALQSDAVDAIDNGDAAGLGLTTDGRGAPFARVVGAKADIGAFEFQGAGTTVPLVVTTALDRNNSTLTPGDVSLREAIRFSGADANKVTFAPALNGQTITLTLGRLVIDRPLTVTGPGAAQLTVSGNNASQVFFINDGAATAAAVNVTGLKLSNGLANGSGGPSSLFGGALINFENLTLDGVTVSDSQANSDGGGIDNESGGTLVITNGTITNNKSGTRGGGLFNFAAGTVSITNTTVSNNQVTGTGTVGGGIANNGAGPLFLINSTISGNKTVGDGGGLAATGAGAVTAKNSTISDNQANNNGGGVFVNAGTLTLNNSTVAFNKAEADGAGAGKGGGVFVGGGTAKMTGTIVGKNDVGTTGASLDIDGLLVGKFSLVSNVTGWNTTGGSNNLTGDPLLGALQSNGGPTFTRVPGTGSPAIDPAGFADTDVNPDALPTDQRGLARKVGASIDIGAVEFAANTPPTITAVANQVLTGGAATAALAFTVGDAETPVASLTVTAASSNTTLVPVANVVFGGGTGAARTVTVTPAAGQTGVTTITLTVSDGTLTTSTTFTVTVNTAGGTNTAPTITAVANQVLTGGAATAALAFTVGDAETPVASLTVTAASSNTTLVPVANVVFGGSGANRTVTVTPAAGQTGVTTITLTVSDGTLTTTTTFTVTVNTAGGGTPALGTPVLVGSPQYAAGSDAGTGGTATLFNPDRSPRFSVTPFGSDFTGGVRTASADFNGDGVADLVVGTGPGRATRVIVYDGVTQAVLFDVAPFESGFTGGVYVAAGDLDGDGKADLAVSPDEGGGPRVRVFGGGSKFAQIADFFGIDDTNFRGGARVAIADISGDGRADLVVAAGFGGGPRVAAFSGTSLSGGVFTSKPFPDFFAFENSLRNGAFVTAGDLDGDGFAELIAGGGPGGGPRVTAFSGKGLLANQQNPVANFFAGDVNSRGGVRLAVKNLDGDNRADLVVGAGSGAGSRVTAYAGKNVGSSGTPAELYAFDAVAGFAGGVYVG